jgi:hypothetical protein
MDAQVETSSRPQYETSEGISKGKQQTNMAALHSKQTIEDKSIEENITTKACTSKENVGQPTNQCLRKNAENRSSSRARIEKQVRYKKTTLITKLYAKLGERRSTSRINRIRAIKFLGRAHLFFY